MQLRASFLDLKACLHVISFIHRRDNIGICIPVSAYLFTLKYRMDEGMFLEGKRFRYILLAEESLESDLPFIK